jgi:hypothetical protein
MTDIFLIKSFLELFDMLEDKYWQTPLGGSIYPTFPYWAMEIACCLTLFISYNHMVKESDTNQLLTVCVCVCVCLCSSRHAVRAM